MRSINQQLIQTCTQSFNQPQSTKPDNTTNTNDPIRTKQRGKPQRQRHRTRGRGDRRTIKNHIVKREQAKKETQDKNTKRI